MDDRVRHAREQVIGLSSCKRDHGEPCELCVGAVDELIAAVTEKLTESPADREGARLQEAYVRGKLLAQSRRDQRIAERVAFVVGWNQARVTMDCGMMKPGLVETARDNTYPRLPLLTKRVPRSVVLSDGRAVSASTVREDNGWRVVNNKGQRCFTSDEYAPFGWAKTPADARLLADLVENPYEDVPDDG